MDGALCATEGAVYSRRRDCSVERQLRAIKSSGQIISRHARIQLREYSKAKRVLSKELGRKPTDIEIAERLGWTEEKVVDTRRFAQGRKPLSIDGGGGGEETFADTFADKDLPRPDDPSLASTLSELLLELGERKRNVDIFLFWAGFTAPEAKPQTFRSVATKYGKSNERIRQIVGRAIERLRESKGPRVIALLDGLCVE